MLKAFKSTLRLFLKQDVSANSEKALIHAELSGSAIFGIWKSFDPGGTFSFNSGSTLMSTVFCFHLAYCFEVFSLAIFKMRCISKLYSVQIFRYSQYFIRFKYSDIQNILILRYSKYPIRFNDTLWHRHYFLFILQSQYVFFHVFMFSFLIAYYIIVKCLITVKMLNI